MVCEPTPRELALGPRLAGAQGACLHTPIYTALLIHILSTHTHPQHTHLCQGLGVHVLQWTGARGAPLGMGPAQLGQPAWGGNGRCSGWVGKAYGAGPSNTIGAGTLPVLPCQGCARCVRLTTSTTTTQPRRVLPSRPHNFQQGPRKLPHVDDHARSVSC